MNENRKKIIISLLSISILLVSFFYFINTLRDKNNQGAEETELTDESSVGTFTDLHFSNPSFVEGSKAYYRGDYQKAIEYYELSKEKASVDEKAVIDISKAHSVFALNRAQGIEDYVKVSKESQYKERMRAIAMLHAYLAYAKYKDSTLLKILAKSYDIPWTNTKEVTYKYMQKVYSLHPFGYAGVTLASYELKATTNPSDVNRIYEQYIPAIDKSIAEIKQNPGEQVVLTSTMLAKARLLAEFYVDFKVSSIEEVKTSFQDLINYSGSVGLKTNKAYTLLSYANFLSIVKDYKGAEESLLILVNEGTTSAIKEALPKINLKTRYPGLFVLQSNTKDKKVLEFLNFIGSSLKK